MQVRQNNALYDLYIVAANVDPLKLKFQLDLLYQNLLEGNERVYVISPKSEIMNVEKVKGVMFICEDDILNNFRKYDLLNYLKVRNIDGRKAGWYFQQFLKLGLCDYVDTPYYATIDSDTFILNKYSLHEDGVSFFIKKKEYHKPYFDTIDRLFNGKVGRWDKNVSFVAELMLFKASIVKQMLGEISDNQGLSGKKWPEKILDAINPDCLNGSGFSEFETYGNYVMSEMNCEYRISKLRTLRCAKALIGNQFTAGHFNWLRKSFDIVSVEEKGGAHLALLTRFGLFRYFITARQLAISYIFFKRLIFRFLFRRPIQEYDYF